MENFTWIKEPVILSLWAVHVQTHQCGTAWRVFRQETSLSAAQSPVGDWDFASACVQLNKLTPLQMQHRLCVLEWLFMCHVFMYNMLKMYIK